MNKLKNTKAFFIAVSLTICMIFSSVTSALTLPFSDVNTENPANEYLAGLLEKGIVKGYNDNTFAPDDICTREQFISFLWRASGSPECITEKTFTDIKGDEYYAKAVEWAYKNDITKIYSDGSFGAGKPTDREHAAYYLYNWVKLNAVNNTKDIMLLDNYADRASISLDSRLPFAWAMKQGLLSECKDGSLSPQNPINRADAIFAIGKLLATHICKWSEYKDNLDGTHTRRCETNSEHTQRSEHTWNNGELTVAPTDNTVGKITYTCTCCLAQKEEKVNAGEKIITRKNVEDSLVYTAAAYEVKGNKIQYDSVQLSDLHYYRGGTNRLSANSAPEYATKDTHIYSVCSDWVYQCYMDAIGTMMPGGPCEVLAPQTLNIFNYSDNQLQSQYIKNKVVEPITEEDIDACLVRWMNFDKYKKSYESRFVNFIAMGLFESDSFTDFCEGLTFKDDGYEGEIHYSYYDSEGKLLTPNEAREKYLYQYFDNYEKNLRPGDVIASQHHAMIYMGNKRILDCNGAKLDLTTGEDKIESDGSILSAMIIPEPFSWKSTSGISLVRPLEFIVREGYDGIPENDIVKGITISEKSKSRIKYPAMDIDRTVNISPYGTAVKNDTLTYTIEISNKTNSKFYNEWITNKDPNKNSDKTYENITVSETIPEGCEYVEGSANSGGKYEKGKLIWNIDKLNAGETIAISYTVKVTGEIGAAIVNDGGMVDNIPSNCIVNIIGGEKINDSSASELLSVASVGSDGLKIFGSDTDFAQNIYKKANIDLELPSVKEICENIFDVVSHIPGDAGLYNVYDPNPVKLYVRKNNTDKEYSYLTSMIVNKFWGGRRYFAGEEQKWNMADNCIKEFSTKYLEAGDIIIYVKAADKENLNFDFSNIGVMVYDGNNLLCCKNTEYEIISEENIVNELNKLLTTDKDLFFALRPSQLIK